MRNVLGAITRQAHARAETTRPGLGPNSRPTPSNSPPRFPHNARSKQNERSTSSANDNFEELWEEAVDDFFARTGVDLSDPEQDLYQRLQRCSSADTIVDALEDISQTFCAYRKGSERAERIRSVLRSVAHGVSVLIDAAAEGAASESFPGGKAVFVAIAVLIKATQGVSERFNTLLAILEKFGFYLSRLHIRLDIGFGPGSRRITVALLSKMVHAFALATQAMRQSRMRHLVSVLFDKDNETEAVAKQVEQLMEEDSRMGLVEIHRAVSQLSDGINETLAPLLSMQTELASIHADVHVVAQITQNGFAALSAQMESHPREHAVPHHLPPSATVPGDIRVASGDAELATRGHTDSARPHTQDVVLVNSDALHERVRALELEIGQMRNLERNRAREGLFTVWHLRASASLNYASLVQSMNELHASFRALNPEDQAALKQALFMLYSVASIIVTSEAGGNVFTAWFAVWLNPGAVFPKFLPLAALYIWAYLSGRRMHALAPSAIPHDLRDPLMETIKLIDVLGVQFILPLERVRSWKELHAILLHEFEHRDGEEYIKSESYKIADATGDAIIEPQSWTEAVRAGMTLNMSIVVRRQFLSCPYCGSAMDQILEKNHQVHCIRCNRDYSATSEPQEKLNFDVRASDSETSTRASSSRNKMFPDTAFKSGHGEHGARDMRLFRKITVAHSQTSLDLKSFGRPNSSVPNSSVPNPSVPNSSVVDVDPEIGRQLKREIENELRIMVQDTRRERELAMTRAKTDDDRGRADRDYEDTMSTLRALATEMYQNRIQKLAHGWSSHGTSEEDDSSDDDYSSGGESQSSSSTAKPRSSRRTPAHPYDRSGVSHNSLLRSADILALNRQREMDMRDMGV